MSKTNRWEDLAFTIDEYEKEIKVLRDEWKDIQNKCNHPNLPDHELGESYRDVCPDCGFVSYCYQTHYGI